MSIVSRRNLLAFPVVASAAIAVTQLAPRLAERAVAGAPAIQKPLPPEWFVDYGTNAEMRWESVDPRAELTPQPRLFVRNHTATPVIDPASYRLRLFGDGLVGSREVRLSLAELKAFAHTELTSVHECTGNGRSFFTTQQGEEVSGTPWTLGAVGAVRWTGVRLRDVLASVGLRPDAVSVMATGLDDHYVDDGVDHGPVRRPFPIGKALDDALLAWGANGEPLLPDHGFPLRLVLPGWAGIGSIKWLGSLQVSTSELTSPWNTIWYTIDGKPVTANPVRSAWELSWDAELAAAKKVRLAGRSWSGAAPIVKVDVSTDGGASWSRARIVAAGRSGAGEGRGWTRWTYEWRSPSVGEHVLLARATDAHGRTQPDVARANPSGYFFDAVVRHPVRVASA